MNAGPVPARERGAATLLVALVLMMSITLLTLAVARTQLAETRMAGNDQRHTRLLLSAQSASAAAANALRKGPEQLAWVPAGSGDAQTSRAGPWTDQQGIETRVLYRRRHADSPFIAIQAVASHPGGALSAQVSREVRLLGVLSPPGESAPPLVINGCLTGAAAQVGIWPLNANRPGTGDALWQYASAPCPAMAGIDVHGGRTVSRRLARPLWDTLFSVSRDEYARLAASGRGRPAGQRRYWMAEPATGAGTRWRLSLGSAQAPVVLYFPGAAGCPRFGAGVRIYGVVFVEAPCPAPLADDRLDIIGTLAINGNADTGHATVQLQHIQTADRRRTRLSLPVLRVVPVPGSWKDF